MKQLFKILGSLRDEVVLIDALDKSTPAVVEDHLSLMPVQDRASATNSAPVDFQWLTGRCSTFINTNYVSSLELL